MKHPDIRMAIGHGEDAVSMPTRTATAVVDETPIWRNNSYENAGSCLVLSFCMNLLLRHDLAVSFHHSYLHPFMFPMLIDTTLELTDCHIYFSMFLSCLLTSFVE